MTVTPFPSCCGAIIISSLWVNLEDEIRTAISTAKKEEKGLILAITIKDIRGLISAGSISGFLENMVK